MIDREAYKHLKENAQERTKYSKTYDLGNGRRKLVASHLPVHHMENGRFKDVDLTPKKTINGYDIKGPDWTLKFNVKKARFKFRYQDKEYSVECLDSPDLSRATVDQKYIKFNEVWPDTDLILALRPRGVEWFKIIKTANGKKSFRWRVSKPDPIFHHKPEILGRDAAGGRTLMDVTVEENAGHNIITETFTGRVTKIADKKSRRRIASDDVKYPVTIDVPDVSVGITAGADDVQSSYYDATFGNGQGMQASNTYVYFAAQSAAGAYSSTGALPALRFQNVAVPQGAIIDLANIVCRQKTNPAPYGVVPAPPPYWYGVDVDNAAAWADPGNRPKDTTKTTAKAQGTTTSSETYTNISHTVTTIVQEIVDRVGWADNNDMAFVVPFIQAHITVEGSNQIAAYEHATEAAPVLEIDYTVAGGAAFSQGAVIS